MIPPGVGPAGLDAAYRRGARWSVVGSVGTTVLQILQMLLFARLAGPAGVGDYALAATVIGFLSPLAEAGLSQAIVQARQTSSAMLATLAWINLALGTLLFGLLWALGPLLAGFYARPDLAGLLLVQGLALLLTPFGEQQAALLTRALRFRALAVIEIAAWSGALLCTVALAAQGWGPWAMALGFVLRCALATAGYLLAAHSLQPVNLLKTSSLRSVWPYLRFGFFDLSARWADFLANYLDKLIVGKWLGTTALGYYQLAFTLLLLPTARLGYMITRVTFPMYALLRTDITRIQDIFKRTATQALLLLLPVYAGIALFSVEIVQLCFGSDWRPAAPLLVIFSVAGLVRTVAVPFPELLKGLGRPQLLLAWMLVFTLALNLSLALFLTLHPTLPAAAWSRVAVKFGLELAMLAWLARQCGLQLAPVLRMAVRVVIGLLPAVAATWLAGQVQGDFWPVLGLKATVFGLGLLWFIFRSSVRETVAALVSGGKSSA